MKRLHSILCSLTAASLLVTVVPAVAQPTGVLDIVPANAWAAVVVRDLRALNNKIVAVGKDLGVPIGPGTMVGDPLTMLKGFLGAVEGLDEKGSVALVVTKVDPLDMEGLQKSMVILVPCTDPKAFLDQYAAGDEEPASEPAKEGDADKAEEPSKEEGQAAHDPDKPKLPRGVVALKVMQQDSYGAVKGNYAILAPAPEAIEAFLAAKEPIRAKMPKERAAVLEKKTDILIWLNVAEAGPAVKESVTNTIMGVMLMASMGDPAAASQAKSIVEGIGKFLDQSEDLQVGLSLNKVGMDIEVYYRVKPDTELARVMAGQQTSNESLLKGLPAEPFMVAMGMVANTSEEKVKDARESIDLLLDNPRIVEHVDAEKMKGFKETVGEFLDLAPTAKWASMSISRLPKGDDGMFGLTIVFETPQASEKWLKVLRKLTKEALALCPSEEAQKYLSKVQYNEAQKIGDAVVDEVSFDMKDLPDAEEEDIATAKKLIGKEGLMLRLAALDPDHVAIVFGGGPSRIEQIAAVAKAGKAPLGDDAGIKGVASQLPVGNRSFELYACGDTIMQVINDAAEAAGEDKPIQVEIPEIAAPLAMVGTRTGNTMQFNIFIPMKLVKGVKDVVTGAMAAKAMPMHDPSESDATEESSSGEDEAPKPRAKKSEPAQEPVQ